MIRESCSSAGKWLRSTLPAWLHTDRHLPCAIQQSHICTFVLIRNTHIPQPAGMNIIICSSVPCKQSHLELDASHLTSNSSAHALFYKQTQRDDDIPIRMRAFSWRWKQTPAITYVYPNACSTYTVRDHISIMLSKTVSANWIYSRLFGQASGTNTEPAPGISPAKLERWHNRIGRRSSVTHTTMMACARPDTHT